VRVMIVEDEVKLAKAPGEGLRADGVLPEVAVAGEDALWMVPARGYDVVCLDVNLPKVHAPATRRVQRGGDEIQLSAKGLQVLEVFLRRPDAIPTRLDLLEGAWDEDYENRSDVIDVYVRHLRERIDRPFGVRRRDTVRGLGHVLRTTPAAADEGAA
jgi:DNA-binding response OmpR family regulator